MPCLGHLSSYDSRRKDTWEYLACVWEPYHAQLVKDLQLNKLLNVFLVTVNEFSQEVLYIVLVQRPITLALMMINSYSYSTNNLVMFKSTGLIKIMNFVFNFNKKLKVKF